MQVEAIYKDGVLKPLQPLELAEDERMRLSISTSTESGGQAGLEYIERLELELRDAPPAPGLDEVRRRLARIPGSLAADFAAEREDR